MICLKVFERIAMFVDERRSDAENANSSSANHRDSAADPPLVHAFGAE